MYSARSYRRRLAPREVHWEVVVPLFTCWEIVVWVGALVLLGMLPLGVIAVLDGWGGEGGGMGWRSVQAVAPFIIVVVVLCVGLFLVLVFGVLRNRRLASYEVSAEGVTIAYSLLPVEGRGRWVDVVMGLMGGYCGRRFIPWSGVIRSEADVVEWKVRLETLGCGEVVLWASQGVYRDVMGAMEYWLHVEN